MKVQDLIDFIKANRGRAAQMDDYWLGEYLYFHARGGGLKWVEEDGKITGLAVLRRTNERPESAVFDWEPQDPEGEYFTIGDLVVTTGNARKELARYFLRTWPDAEKIYGHDKQGQVKPLSRAFVERLSNGNQGRSTAAKGHRSRDRGVFACPDKCQAGATGQ